MTYEEIAQETNEILDSVPTMVEDEIEDALGRVDELSEFLEKLNEDDDSEDDTEYQETAELIEEAKHLLTEELDSKMIYEPDDDY